MQKRREAMADGRRYIIYYSFEKAGESALGTGQNETAEEAEVNQDV